MKNKKILAGLLAASMILAAGCGEKGDKTKNNDISSVTDNSAEASPQGNSEGSDKEPDFSFDYEEPEEETPASAEELKEVQELIKKYETAAKEKDYETLAEITNTDMLLYLTTGNESTREEQIASIKGETDSDALVVEPDYISISCGEPHCFNSQAAEYNDFLSDESINLIAPDIASKYKIDGLYSFRMNAETDSDDEVSGLSSNIDTDNYVLRINGEWKIDSGYSYIVGMLKMLSSMDLD